MLHEEIPGYGQQPTTIIYMTLNSLLEPQEKEGLINWVSGRIGKYITCLYGNPLGEMILKHVTKYVQDKYRSPAPFHFREIEKIVDGTPYHFPKAKEFIQAQTDQYLFKLKLNHIESMVGQIVKS